MNTRILDRNVFVKMEKEDRITYLRNLVYTSGCLSQYARMAGHSIPFTNTPDDFCNQIRYNDLNSIDIFDSEFLTMQKSIDALKVSTKGVWPYERNVSALMDLVLSGHLAR